MPRAAQSLPTSVPIPPAPTAGGLALYKERSIGAMIESAGVAIGRRAVKAHREVQHAGHSIFGDRQRVRYAARCRRHHVAAPQIAAEQVAGARLALVKPLQPRCPGAHIQREWPASDDHFRFAEPLDVYVARWFDRRRGSALALIASGQAAAGTIWASLFGQAIEWFGWRHSMQLYAVLVIVVVLPAASLVFRALPKAARAGGGLLEPAAGAPVLGFRPRTALGLLCLASFLCCVPMAMPQGHLVAFCSDVGIPVTRGSAMLSLLLAWAFIGRQLGNVTGKPRLCFYRGSASSASPRCGGDLGNPHRLRALFRTRFGPSGLALAAQRGPDLSDANPLWCSAPVDRPELHCDLSCTGGATRSVRWAAHESGGLKSLRRSDEGRCIQRRG
jgi:hypothetical protein